MYTGGLLGLIYAAGPMAKAVIGILFFFSIVSWTIIFVKLRQFSKTEEQADRFFRAIKDADSFKRLVSVYRDSSDNAFYRLVLACYKEVTSRQKDNPGAINKEAIPALENILKITIAEESVKLERRLSFPRDNGKYSPLYRTFRYCLGHYGLFREIGVRGTTSLAVVAPGISEALIATAIGLATAIPAVLGYNYCLGRLRRITHKNGQCRHVSY